MNESHEAWMAAAGLALAGHGVGRALAETVLGEVSEHCADSGEHPRDAFGSPDQFAAEVARERLPVAVRAERDRDELTAGEYVSGGMASLGWIAVIAGLALWASVGAMVPVSWAGLVGATLLALALLVVGGLRDAVRAAGQPRLAGWTHAVTALLALLAAVAFVGLPQAEIGRIPAAAVAAGGAVLCALAARHPRPRNRERHAPEADPSPATHPGGPDGPEEWLGRLAGLLEGRHDLPRSQAAELVEEARSHLAATGRAPAAEFGPVEEYALRLAEPVLVRHSPWWRRPTVQAAVLTAAGGYWLVENLLVHGPAWRTALAAGVVLASGGPLVGWRPR